MQTQATRLQKYKALTSTAKEDFYKTKSSKAKEVCATKLAVQLLLFLFSQAINALNLKLKSKSKCMC